MELSYDDMIKITLVLIAYCITYFLLISTALHNDMILTWENHLIKLW